LGSLRPATHREGARVVLSAPHEATAAAAATRLVQNADAPDTVARVVADNADPATPGLLIAAAQDRLAAWTAH